MKDYFKGYEIRGRYDAVLAHGQSLKAPWVLPEDKIVVDRSAFNDGNYNKVVAHVTSDEAAQAVIRLMGSTSEE